nr:TMV resistance protein N-like [Ziziphus jujuba var. spinosa]
MASSSLSSAISIQEMYDVFLSFRGEDTRNQFASYLYAALSAKHISTFMDDHQLERGDQISPTLRKAIHESKIWVIIFSENFASSTWCLDELAEILECKKRSEQGTVMPIFYGTDPSAVRKQEGGYGVALNLRNVLRIEWRRPECKLVLLKLPKYLSNEHFYGHLIGIGKKVEEIELLLSIGSTDVHSVGIWGMGSIGKNIQDMGPIIYEKKLLSELLNDEAILKMDSPFVASPCILDRLRHAKVLIVLDDVDSSTQLEALVEGCYRLAPGSRIIVTTRNMQVLKKVTDRFYKVELVNHTESLELFRLHASGKKSPVIDDEMVLEVTRYANGNPLALKVLGSFLHSKSKEEWKIALNKLKIIPNPEIQDVL